MLMLLLSIFLLLSPADQAAAADSIEIAVIEADPDLYHLRQVTLTGRVHEVQLLDPYFQPSGAACTGAYLFTLEDDTGYMPVSVLGVCGVPIARSIEVTEGDTVTVHGVVHAPGRFGASYGLDGKRRTGANPLHLVAKSIAPAPPSKPGD